MAKIKKPPPFIPNLILKLFLRGEDYYEFSDDINEVYRYKIDCESKRLAKLWYWLRLMESIPGIILDKIHWRTVMLKNYLKIALRNFLRHKGYSFINIAGFAIGMAVCLLILVFVRHELSYDKYHKDGNRVYRIAQDIRTPTANRVFAPISPMVAPTLKTDYPQVEQAARSLTTSSRLVRREDTFFYEDRFMFADPELFEVLTIPFIQGNPQEALKRPRTLVISERMSIKYFGHDNPLGKTLEINNEIYEVTGVVIDPPENTHLKYDLMASMESLAGWGEMTNWYSTMFYTYLKLKPNVNVKEFSQQANNLADKYVGEQLKEWGNTYHYFLQPISSIHQQRDRYRLEF